MNIYTAIVMGMVLTASVACTAKLELEVYETSRSGRKMEKIAPSNDSKSTVVIDLNAQERHQTITGIGGSFTEATAHLLQNLSEAKRAEVLEAYFGESGARYSLTRTHINSCDFSLSNYSYAPVPNDLNLEKFSIQEDMNDIIPVIKQAQQISKDGFKVVASPWTAPPWMKDNKDWKSGKLLPEFYPVWALFFSKYLTAYAEQGIPIWAVTVENEPLGNGGNWESMHYTAEEMNLFVKKHLGPKLRADGHSTKIFGYDQNRDDFLKTWVDAMYDDAEAAAYFDGTAVHWYAGTKEVFADALQYAKNKAPEKHLIESEGCIDAEVPRWNDDDWYWRAEATDWGFDWAPPERKHFHPKYEPVYRYVRDIIGSLNNGVDGWIDWNMVLDKQGGPNWAKNWCIAPVIADVATDSVYYTPLYYAMWHASRFIRPGAVRIGNKASSDNIQVTATENPDGTIAVLVLNTGKEAQQLKVRLAGKEASVQISGEAFQTLVIEGDKKQHQQKGN
jgi:glucosylceramidase